MTSTVVDSTPTRSKGDAPGRDETAASSHGVTVQRRMAPVFVVIGNVILGETVEMLLAQDNHVIQQLAAKAPDPTFGHRILPW